MLIDDVDFNLPVANIKFSYAVDGFGEKGVSTGQLEFDMYDKNDTVGDMYLQGLSAVVIEKKGAVAPSKPYYLAKRSVNDHVVHFVAYDAMSKTDKAFEVPYIPDPDSENPTPGAGYIVAGGVMEAIKTQCEFTNIGYTAAGDEMFKMKFTREMLTGQTCRQIMGTIAENSCGTWVSGADGGIVLVGLGTSYGVGLAADKYAEINNQGRQKITKLAVTDTESGAMRSYNSGELGTVIAIETPFPTVGPCIWERIENQEYRAWNCEKAILSNPFYPDSNAAAPITLGETTLAANSFTLSLDSTGIYFSGGCDPQDEAAWKYQDYTQREIEQRVKIGKTVGNTQITSDGIVFINENETANEDETATGTLGSITVDKHGFSVGGKGVTKYDGAMADKTLPAINVESDLSGFECDYGDGVVLAYDMVWDGDNVTLSEREEG